jgi:hypothetical protein
MFFLNVSKQLLNFTVSLPIYRNLNFSLTHTLTYTLAVQPFGLWALFQFLNPINTQ